MWTRALATSRSAPADALRHGSRRRGAGISGASSIRESSFALGVDGAAPPGGRILPKQIDDDRPHGPCCVRRHRREYHSHHRPGYDRGRLPRPRAAVPLHAVPLDADADDAIPTEDRSDRPYAGLRVRDLGPPRIGDLDDDDDDEDLLECSQYDEAPPLPRPPLPKRKKKTDWKAVARATQEALREEYLKAQALKAEEGSDSEEEHDWEEEEGEEDGEEEEDEEDSEEEEGEEEHKMEVGGVEEDSEDEWEEEEDSDDEPEHGIDLPKSRGLEYGIDLTKYKGLPRAKDAPPPPPISKITIWECTSILNRACSMKRGIRLNKRQRIKPWIPALLMHRYDRGIRDREELCKDNVYYHALRKDNWGIGGGLYEHNPHMMATNNPINEYLDLKKVLKPAEHEVHAFIHSLHNAPGANEDDRRLFNFTKKARKRAKAFLIKEKMALLAYEARGVIQDRELPFLELTGMSEDEALRLAERDPGIFLSHFCKVMALVELQIEERGGDGLADFSKRRYYPPSLDGGIGREGEGVAGGKKPEQKKKKKGKGGHAIGQHPNQIRKRMFED